MRIFLVIFSALMCIEAYSQQDHNELVGQWYLFSISTGGVKTEIDEYTDFIMAHVAEDFQSPYRYDEYEDNGEVFLRTGQGKYYQLEDDSLIIYEKDEKGDRTNSVTYGYMKLEDGFILSLDRTKEYRDLFELYGVDPKSIESVQIGYTYNRLYDETEVDTVPQFPGGEEAMQQFFSDRMVYPEALKGSGFGLQLVIDKMGYASLYSLKNTDEYDSESDSGGLEVNGISIGEGRRPAVEVLSKMPRWVAGRKNGDSVDTKIQILVHYQ